MSGSSVSLEAFCVATRQLGAIPPTELIWEHILTLGGEYAVLETFSFFVCLGQTSARRTIVREWIESMQKQQSEKESSSVGGRIPNFNGGNQGYSALIVAVMWQEPFNKNL